MKKMIFGLLMAATAIPTVAVQPAMAQPAGWDAGRFWQGAPQGVGERLDFLQHRIDGNASNGNLDRGEAERCQRELDNLRRMLKDMLSRDYGRLTDRDRYQLQQRLDDLARSIHWLSNNGWNDNRPAPPPPVAQGGWDAGQFWQGAPQGAGERLSFLQQRIDAGARNGSLDRGETERCQRALDGIRGMQKDMLARNYGRLTDNDRYQLQQRLDDLARSIRWLSKNGWNDNRPAPPPIAQGGWDAGHFWQGAPQGAGERITFLQQRIDAGARSGKLDRGEAERCQRALDGIHNMHKDMVIRDHGRLTDNDRYQLQQRLDELARSIRWLSNNGWADDRPAGPPPGTYYPDRDYRDGPQYQTRHISRDEPIYRGNDGRYYCRRNDGTTGLIVGGIAGGLLGNIIAPGGSKTLGTILGAGGGAAIGSAVDRDNVTCR